MYIHNTFKLEAYKLQNNTHIFLEVYRYRVCGDHKWKEDIIKSINITIYFIQSLIIINTHLFLLS